MELITNLQWIEKLKCRFKQEKENCIKSMNGSLYLNFPGGYYFLNVEYFSMIKI